MSFLGVQFAKQNPYEYAGFGKPFFSCHTISSFAFLLHPPHCLLSLLMYKTPAHLLTNFLLEETPVFG